MASEKRERVRVTPMFQPESIGHSGQSVRQRAGIIRVILPAYNEREGLPALLKRLDVAFEEGSLTGDVLVVNDGSTDDTVSVVRNYTGQLTVRLLDLQPNRGLAEALKNGLLTSVAECEAGDIIITMDADNTHTPGLILRMVRMIREGSDVVIASRYQPGSRVRGVSRLRKFLSFGASVLFRILVRIPGARDYTSGYRAYRAELIQSAFDLYRDELIHQTGFACMAELLVKLKTFDPIIHEVPVILRYDMKSGASKMRVWHTVGETLSMLFRHVFSAIDRQSTG